MALTHERISHQDLGRFKSLVAARAHSQYRRICERYGGGGHAVVGAISLPPDAVEQGREYMKEIIAELQFED